MTRKSLLINRRQIQNFEQNVYTDDDTIICDDEYCFFFFFKWHITTTGLITIRSSPVLFTDRRNNNIYTAAANFRLTDRDANNSTEQSGLLFSELIVFEQSLRRSSSAINRTTESRDYYSTAVENVIIFDNKAAGASRPRIDAATPEIVFSIIYRLVYLLSSTRILADYL